MPTSATTELRAGDPVSASSLGGPNSRGQNIRSGSDLDRITVRRTGVFVGAGFAPARSSRTSAPRVVKFFDLGTMHQWFGCTGIDEGSSPRSR